MGIDDFAICFENLLLIYYFDMFLVRRWKHPAIVPAAIVIIWSIQFVVHHFLPGKALILLALDMLVAVVLYRENTGAAELLRKLFLLVVHWGLATGIQATAIAVTLHLSGDAILLTEDLLADPQGMIETFAMYVLSHFLVVIILERVRKVERVPLSNAMWLKLIAMPVGSWLFVYRIFPYNQRNIDSATLHILTGFSLLIILLNLYAFHVYRSSAKAALIYYRYQELQTFCEAQEEYFQSQLSMEKKVRTIIHDVLHNQELLAAMLLENRTGEAYRFLQKWGKDIKRHKTQKYTGNWIVDTILTCGSCSTRDGGPISMSW